MNLSTQNISDTEFSKLTKTIHKMTGISINDKRRTMLERRLDRRLKEYEIDSYSGYLKILASSVDEQRLFVNLVTTNETYFYRTPRIWNYITNTLIPEWRDKSTGGVFKAWSAASSTGEEAYTLGIILESFRSKYTNFNYEVHGTDISTSVVDKARTGLYTGRSIGMFREECPVLFKTYMEGDDQAGYSAVGSVRSRVNISIANLFDLKDHRTQYDLILIRNVLIYFNKSDQAIVMSTIHDRLNKNGKAIIGESESLISLDTNLEAIDHTIYQSKNSSGSHDTK